MTPEQYAAWQEQRNKTPETNRVDLAKTELERVTRQDEEKRRDRELMAAAEEQETKAGLIKHLAETVRSQSPEAAAVFVQHALDKQNFSSAEQVRRTLDQVFGLFQDARLTGAEGEMDGKNLETLVPVVISGQETNVVVSISLYDYGSKPVLNFSVTEKKSRVSESRTLNRRAVSTPTSPTKSGGIGNFFKGLFGRGK